jgi:hypothetical protein
MFTRIKRPSAPMVVSVAALLVALGGTSYAAAKIQGKDIANGAVTSAKIKNGTIQNRDLARSARAQDGQDGLDGLDGVDGQDGEDGQDGADGTGRWLLVDRMGAIVAQSGGFEIRTAYDLVNNQEPATPMIPGGALGNVYIDANEDLSDNGIVVSIALQNQYNQDELAGNAGRNPGSDANPEFSGEITSTICGVTGIVACAPAGANNREHLVVSPRLSDGQVTVSGSELAGGSGPNTHKRFYVIITGDSSDLPADALTANPALELAANPPVMR